MRIGPNSVLGFGCVGQALCILLLVFLCEFLFALLLLCEHGRYMVGSVEKSAVETDKVVLPCRHHPSRFNKDA